MLRQDLARFIDGTLDPAYVVDNEGTIMAWNDAARKLFGLTSAEVIGRPCRGVVRGFDECGLVCSDHCLVQQSITRRVPVENFDLRVQSVEGELWCTVSIVLAECRESVNPYAVHILRRNDLRKKLEVMVRDFVVRKTDLSADQVNALMATRRGQRESHLSPRETEILRLMAACGTTGNIAKDLNISRTTVSNHIQHILQKLDAHNRLEAIRKAEHAGLI